MTQNQDGNNSQNQGQQMEDTGSGQGQPGTFTGGSGGQAGNSGAGRSDMGQAGNSGAGRSDMDQAGSGGQQRQYEQGGGQMGGDSGGRGDESRFADQIREHMQVIDADGNDVGMVDSCEDGQIKLTREGSPDGEHRYLQMNEVEAVEGDTVRLRSTGNSTDNAGFGQGV